MGPHKVPKGWMGCPNAGDGLVADKFFAFKTPLSSCFDNRITKNQRWNPDAVFNHAREHNIDIGLWIDLTNTERYFDKNEIEIKGIQYLKLSLGGHGTVPNRLAVEFFASYCEKFFNANPGKIIGIHCTHGFNRTGFLILCYLVLKCKFNIRDAYEEFVRGRPPGIYRQNYISILWNQFSKNNSVPLVQDPYWLQHQHPPPPPNPVQNSSSSNSRKGDPIPNSYPLPLKPIKSKKRKLKNRKKKSSLVTIKKR